MAEVVRFESGGIGVLVRIPEQSPAFVEVGREAKAAEVIEESGKSLDAAVSVVAPTANALFRQMQGFDVAPREVSVEFGLQLEARVKAFVIAEAGAQANFNITLTWSRDTSPEQPGGTQQESEAAHE